jgi:hypothetical protein
VYVVKLSPNLLEENARIIASSAMPREALTAAATGVSDASGILPAPLSGTTHNGYNEVTAQIAPGTSGTVVVTFDIVVVSVAALPFDLYRAALKEILGVGTETGITEAAGIKTLPPPQPSSRMATYVLELFTDVVFGGIAVADQSRVFSDQDCTTGGCRRMLEVTRSLEVREVQFSGTLTASSQSPATAEVAAYVPITAIEFSDGLTIPFAGYSDNVLVDYGGLRPCEIPGEFWSEVAGGDGAGVGGT